MLVRKSATEDAFAVSGRLGKIIGRLQITPLLEKENQNNYTDNE
jgi:hypothetical protein